jgi:hypothetical protein
MVIDLIKQSERLHKEMKLPCLDVQIEKKSRSGIRRIIRNSN